MELLEKRIREDGEIYAGDVLKVDSFLNHQMDVDFLCEVGKEFYRLFADCGVNKILTIEASGIGIACLTAQFFHCPVLFAKKKKTSNIASDVWQSTAHSYTHGVDYGIVVEKRYLTANDRVLLIDDFLANGEATNAMLDLCRQAGATVIGAGIVVEKAYQPGGENLRRQGIRVESLARVKSMSEKDGIQFC